MSWPASLEACPLIGWSETPTQNIVEFETDIGPPKRRRRASRSGTRVSADYKLKRVGAIGGAGDQLATFWTFYQSTIVDGVNSFTIKHPRTGAIVTAFFEAVPQVQQETPNTYIVSMQMRMFT